MKVMIKRFSLITGFLMAVLSLQEAQGAVALDRTRIIFDGAEKSISLNISNENKQLPYLAQGWIEDVKGNKVTSPMMVLPPLQRLEPGAKSQLKIQSKSEINALPQNRETLYYFNLREIPPRSSKPNTLQLALQTRVKLFFRPKALAYVEGMTPWQEQLTLTKLGDKYQVNNPTGYYVTIIDANNKPKTAGDGHFVPVMVAPKSSETLNQGANILGGAPVLTYINDFGGRPQLQFNCSGSSCKATSIKLSNQ